jgi:sulfate transport system permease protein
LPGYGLSLGVTLAMLACIVVVPLSMIVLKTADMGWARFWRTVTAPRALAAYGLTFGASFAAAAVNTVFGVLVAWVLTRYRFVGRKLLDALIDLPFAVPTAVSGIALTALFARNGWFGGVLARVGIDAAYTRLGIVVALTFVSLPFVVRTVQPVLAEIEPDMEESAATLGAGRLRTFATVVLPQLLPALLTGFTLAFARAIGEYGSVVFISSNMPMETEIASLLIMSKLDQFDFAGATAIAVVMLVVSFALLLAINRVQAWSRRRTGQRT